MKALLVGRPIIAAKEPRGGGKFFQASHRINCICPPYAGASDGLKGGGYVHTHKAFSLATERTSLTAPHSFQPWIRTAGSFCADVSHLMNGAFFDCGIACLRTCSFVGVQGKKYTNTALSSFLLSAWAMKFLCIAQDRRYWEAQRSREQLHPASLNLYILRNTNLNARRKR